MVFSSPEFLLLFLPLTLLVYFIIPQKHLKARNAALFALSLLFYGWGEPLYVFLMLFSLTVTYLFGFFVEKNIGVNRRRARKFLVCGVVFDLLILGFFKYYDFLADLIPFVPDDAKLGIGLPIGISFYTFQIMSYLIDVYRRDAVHERSFISYGTYVTLFPQLIAGPIVKYHDISEMLGKREHSFDKFSSGVLRFTVGLAKKVILANSAGAVFEELCSSSGERTVLGAWIGMIMFAFQIYFDFSAYSDMAIGLGRMFGFEFLENFNYPYISKSITEFWRRWHISLSTWFREYLYIPLGGNRKGKGRTYLNLLIVWAATGIWHGASLNFLFWGLYYFVFLVIEKAFFGKLLKKLPSFAGHIYTLLVVLFGWVFFNFTDTNDCFSQLGNMFGSGTVGFASERASYTLVCALPLLFILALGATPLPKKLYDRLTVGKSDAVRAVFSVFGFALLAVSTAYVATSGFNPFLYSRF